MSSGEDRGLVNNAKGSVLAAVGLSPGCGNGFILCKEKFLETNEHRLPNLERERRETTVFIQKNFKEKYDLFYFLYHCN